MVMHVELQATCSALGYQENNTYIKEPDSLETVKDLIRFLKREDETCDIRRQLGHAQILQNDLIPILKVYIEDDDLFETVIRLMVNLTQPALLCFNNEVPEDKTQRNYYLEIETILQQYKQAFADENLFAVLTKKFGNLLQLDWETRQEEDRLLIERILILVRNVFHVRPDTVAEKRTDDDATVHDQVLWALHVSGMEDLLLYIASSDEERHFCMHCLEIISLMFREQTPEQLACAGGQRSMTEKQKDEQELGLAIEREKARKAASMMKYSTRHSRFGGTFVCQNIKSISEENLIYHRSLGDVGNISYDMGKVQKKKAKNRQPIKDVELIRRSTLSIRLFLKEFCIQFLENCYNPLMYSVKDNLLHARAQDHDETYYLWSMRFFMEFNRHYNFRVGLVGETMSVPIFHYIQTQLMNYHEMIFGDKKEAISWSKRLHLALRVYRELLLSLQSMDKSKDLQLRESSKVIKNNIFYMIEYRDIFLILLKKFNESKNSRSYLQDLIETCHIYTKMLDHFAKTGAHIMVQKKKRKKAGKKKKKQPEAAQAQETEEEKKIRLEELWDRISGDLSAIFQEREDVPEDISPFDATSEVDIDQQRVDAVIRIQNSLRNELAGEAVAIFRAAREVWPEREEFGAADITPEDEFMALREIFFTDIPRTGEETAEEQPPEEDEIGEVEEEEFEDVRETYAEQEFDMQDFLVSFANPHVLKPYALLFSEFEKNSTFTNHCIVRLFHRLAFDLKIPGVLFQACIFRTFQKLLFHSMKRSEMYKEMVKFSTFVVSKFIESAQNNEKLFMEILFWKSKKEAIEVAEGYGTYKERYAPKKAVWSEEQIEELRYLYDQYKDVEGELDVADQILASLTDTTKTRRQIVRQLVEIDLIESAADLKKKKTSRSSNIWREEEELELRDLFNQFKDSDDPVGNIVSNMTNKRSKPKVIEKILALQLVEDKKELYKKRKRKNRQNNRLSEDDQSVDGREHLEAASKGSESEDNLTDQSDIDDSDKENIQQSEFMKLIDTLKGQGMQDQLKWIQSSLQKTADDREEDEDDDSAVPIVPLSEGNENAMENNTFKTVLKKLGIASPVNEEERFWRIPSTLKPDDLRTLCRNIDHPEDYIEATNKSQKKNSARFQALKNMAKEKKKDNKAKEKETRAKRRSANKVIGPNTGEALAQPKKKKLRIKRVMESDSSDDSDNERLVIDNEDTQPHKRARLDSGGSSSRQTTNDTVMDNVSSSGSRSSSGSSSDSDSDSSGDESPSKKPPSSKTSSDQSSDEGSLGAKKPVVTRATSDESDDDDELLVSTKKTLPQPITNLESFPATMLSQPIGSDSDSDIDDHVTLKKVLKRRTIDSDSDADD